MKAPLILSSLALLLLAMPALPAAPIQEAVQKGLAAEEIDHDLDRAIAAYESAIAQFDGNRKAVATAIYRLAECERKQGKLAAAQVHYARIVREFSDQAALAQQSQAQLPAAAVSKAAATPDPEGDEIQQLQSMLASSPDLINAPANGKGPTPLQQAISKGEMRVATYLLDQHAEINLATDDSGPPLFIATRNARKDFVDLLIAHGANVNFQDRNGAAALHLAANRGFIGVTESLIAAKADVNIRGGDLATPLHNAAARNQPVMIELLLKHGADLEAKQNGDWTPLYRAVAENNLAAARVLLAHGAKTQGCLASPVGRDNVEMAKLLLDYSADAKSSSSGTPLLTTAVMSRNVPMVQLLLTHGADPNAMPGDNVERLPALFEAIKLDDPDIARLLLEHGADVNKITTQGLSALNEAISLDRPQLLLVLLAKGADVNQVSALSGVDRETRYSPLAVANRQQRPKMIQLLAEHGAVEMGSDRDAITVTRKSTFSRVCFGDGQLFSQNHFRLFDMLQAVYQDAPLKREPASSPATSGAPSTTSTAPSFRVQSSRRRIGVYARPSGSGPDYSSLLFPALDRIVIHRWSAKIPRQETLIPVKVLDAEGHLDPKQNLWLQKGDAIEIPEQPHSLADRPYGLTAAQMQGLDENYARQVTFETALGTKTLSVPPPLSTALQREDVLLLLPSDADSSRMEIRRTDPASGKPITFTANVPLGGNTTPEMDNVWLLNGDLVKIPSAPIK